MHNSRILLCLFFSLTALPLIAQSSSPGKHLDVAYFGHFLIQPGLSIGSSINFQSWQSRERSNTQSLFVRPQVGYYLQSNHHQTYLAALAFGYGNQKRKKRGWAHQALSLGVSYHWRSTQESFSVSLADGSRSNSVNVSTAGWLPTINYTQGIPIHSQLSGYYRLMVGQLFENSGRNSASLFTEIGLRFYFH